MNTNIWRKTQSKSGQHHCHWHVVSKKVLARAWLNTLLSYKLKSSFKFKFYVIKTMEDDLGASAVPLIQLDTIVAVIIVWTLPQRTYWTI